jgi:hypothetical protein
VTELSGHPVRIARVPAGEPRGGTEGRSTSTPRAGSAAPSDRGEENGGGGWRENRAGLERSCKLFLWGFLVVPLLLWSLLVSLVLTSPYVEVRTDTSAVAALTLLVVAIIAVGFALTVSRTPRRVRSLVDRSELRIVPFSGTARTFRVTPEAYQASLESYPRGFLASEETELIELILPPWKAQRWIVEAHLLDDALPRHPPRKKRRAGRFGGDGETGEDLGSSERGEDPSRESSPRTD